MDYSEIYRAAYRIFSKSTPLRADCGKLCRNRCCRGSVEDGMILFPHEETVAAPLKFLTVTDAEMRGISVKFAVCAGRCIRALRPLSCRIYPFAPQISGGHISVRPDPRAKAICPLLIGGEAQIEKVFFDDIKRCFESLLVLPGMGNFLADYNHMLDEYMRFTG